MTDHFNQNKAISLIFRLEGSSFNVSFVLVTLAELTNQWSQLLRRKYLFLSIFRVGKLV